MLYKRPLDRRAKRSKRRWPKTSNSRRMSAGIDEKGALALEPLDGPLVGGAVLAHVGDGGVPLRELLVEVELVDERASWVRIPVKVISDSGRK